MLGLRWSASAFVQVLVAATLALVGVAVVGSAGAAQQPAGDEAFVRVPGVVGEVREVAGLRSEHSRTFERADGSGVTRVSAGSLNFRDGQGGWSPIDSSLVASDRPGYALSNKANRFRVDLPQTLAGAPVRVEEGGAWAEFSLEGAQGSASASAVRAESVRYQDALPGLDVVYTAGPDAVKEDLVLASPAAGHQWSFSLRTSSGLEPRATGDGGIDFRDGNGASAFSFAPPSMRDSAPNGGAASQAVRFELTRTGQDWTVGLVADRGWLEDPERVYPVTVDPSVHFDSPYPDCDISSTAPTATTCNSQDLVVRRDGANETRGLLRFNVEDYLPEKTQIVDAKLKLYLHARTTTTPLSVSMHRITRAFAAGVTWNTYNGTNNWTTPGGDFVATAGSTASVGATVPGFVELDAKQVVQEWANGQPNHGFLLNATGGPNTLSFRGAHYPDPTYIPQLDVEYQHRHGLFREFSYDTHPLSERSQVAVNVANGNLVYTANDVSMAGNGLDLDVSRTWNNIGSRPLNNAGYGWQLSGGMGARLIARPNGDQVFNGPTGSRHLFVKTGTTWTSPPAIDATLTTSGAGHQLYFDTTAETFTFNADGDLTQHKDRNNNQINYSYSAPGKLSTITDTRGRTITATYNAAGRLSKLADATGREWQYSYDGSSRPITYTDPEGKQTSYTYASTGGHLETITDPRGTVTRLDYDTKQRLVSIKRHYNTGTGSYTSRTQYAYQAVSAPCNTSTDIGKTVLTDPRNNTITYCYDERLRVTKMVDQLGHTGSSTYSANSDPLTETREGSATTTNTYSSGNNLTQSDAPAGERSAFEYNNAGFPRFATKGTNPQGTATNYSYDSLGNLGTVTDGQSPTQVQATLEYNGTASNACTDNPSTKPGTIRCAIDGNGNQTDYGYDSQGQLTTVTPELPIGQTTLTWDSLSRVKTITDAKAQTRTFSYDKLDRVTNIAYSNGSSIAYGYDDNGNQTSRTDSVHGSSSWTYDRLNRRTGDTLPSGSSSYSWDAASNVTSLSDPGGTVGYRYDPANRLQDLAEPGGSCTGSVSLCTTFGYSNRDQRTTTSYPNGVVQSVTYDSSDKPTRVRAVKGATVHTDFTYTFNVTGSPASETGLRQTVTDKNNNKTTYGYDPLDRLTSAVERNSSQTIIDNRSWTYDNASNRTSQTVNGTTTSYGHNAANQLCWEHTGSSANPCGTPPTGSTTYNYDANGNTTTTSAGLSFAYNIKDQTSSYTPPGGSAVNFGYAGPNQTERTSSAGDAQHNTLVGVTREGTTSWVRDPGGTLVSQKSGSTRQYYLTDNLGSIVGLTDSTGTLAQTYKYDPYGVVRSTTGSVSNPWQYVGQYRHGSGAGALMKIGARYYRPGLGRWTQQDPLDQPDDLRNGNRYAYAGADPVNMTDPTGTRFAGYCWKGAKGGADCPSRVSWKDVDQACALGGGADGARWWIRGRTLVNPYVAATCGVFGAIRLFW